MKCKIMTDSNSGFTKEEADELGIEVVPMPFMIDGVEYFENINLTQEKFYEFIETAKVSTSQPSIGMIAKRWEELLKEYDEIVYIPMSSGLSMSCHSAMALASTNYEGRVYVIDNQRISLTQKRSVYEALRLSKLNYRAMDIKDILTKNKFESSIYICVNDLKYLLNGGRVTPAVYTFAKILKIKPILQIHGEKLDAFRKTRTIENAKRIMIDKIKEDMKTYPNTNVNDFYIDIAHSNNYDEAIKFKKQVEEEFGVNDTLVNPLSLSVSCHIGPGSLGLGITKKIKL